MSQNTSKNKSRGEFFEKDSEAIIKSLYGISKVLTYVQRDQPLNDALISIHDTISSIQQSRKNYGNPLTHIK